MNVNDLFERRTSFFLTPSSTMKGFVSACLLVGAISLGYGFATGAGTEVWGAYLFNLFFFFAIALGGMAFSAMQDLIGASWARPIKRLHEGFGAFVPVAVVLFLIFVAAIIMKLGGAGDVYRWIKDPSVIEHFHGKDVWLQPGFMYVRVAVILAVILGLVMWQFKQNLTRDKLFLEGRRDEALKAGEESRFKLRYWSAPILLIYGIAFTFLGFDLIMSLSPLWFSTLFGGWLFAIMMQTLMALLLIIMFSLKDSEIGGLIQRQQFHDVGKLMHGFSIFFAYLTYAHILTFWFGNMPEETEYLLHRMHAPWIYLAIGIPLLAFVVPLYVMIFKAAKWTPSVAVPIALCILGSQWFTYMLIVMPDVVDGSKMGMPLVEVGLFFGFLGLFLATYFWFGRRFPMVGLADPILPEALQGEHH